MAGTRNAFSMRFIHNRRLAARRVGTTAAASVVVVSGIAAWLGAEGNAMGTLAFDYQRTAAPLDPKGLDAVSDTPSGPARKAVHTGC
jgi:hypothetical protein